MKNIELFKEDKEQEQDPENSQELENKSKRVDAKRP